MEKKIIELFDDISLEEAEELLDQEIDIAPDRRASERIKYLTLQKAGLHPKKTRRFSTWMAASAAAVIIITATFMSVGPDSVLATIQKMFNFIPGYGIVEDMGEETPDKILYMLDEPVMAENDDAILSLHNAVATKNTITVMVELTQTSMSYGQTKKEIEKQYENSLPHSRISLYTSTGEYAEFTGSMVSGSEEVFHYTCTYSLNADEINTNETYRIECAEYNISLDFKLKRYETFGSLEDIGATDIQNDISITAVAKEKDGKLNVELYPLNHQYDSSRPESLSIYSFTKYGDYGYQGDDLHLQTNTGRKAYALPGSYAGPNTKFTFDITPEDRELTLKIPYILVQSRESQTVSLKTPKFGEKITVNKRVEFNGCTLIIKDVERIGWEGGEGECLKMNYAYENNMPNKILMDTRVVAVDAFGGFIGGGGSYEMDGNGIATYYDFFLDEEYGNTVRLNFANPVYYLTDAYTLKLTR